MNTILVLSCEHATNNIPDEFRDKFAAYTDILETHQGYDIGAFPVFEHLKNATQAPAISARWSRLLIDLNRSLNHPRCFSDLSKTFSQSERFEIINKYYAPYQNALYSLVEAAIKNNQAVVHISVHSFTPTLNNQIRNADIGLLYDPKRHRESLFCKEWKNAIKKVNSHLTLRFNYPYRGISDGLCTNLRKAFTNKQYAGIELEINQKHLVTPNKINLIKGFISQSLLAVTE